MNGFMLKKQFLTENDLATLAKRFREQSGKTRAQAARDLKVAQTSIFNAEETPKMSLLKMRIRIITAYSSYKVKGPVFFLEKK